MLNRRATCSFGELEQARDLLDAWKATNESLLNTAFNKLDDFTRKAFNQIDSMVDKVNNDKEVTVGEVRDLTAQWSQIISNLPLANHDVQILTYSPRVIVPVGETTIALRIEGPNLANAGGKLTWQGYEFVPSATKQTELLAQLDRSSLTFPDTVSRFVAYRFDYERTPSAFFFKNWTHVDLTMWLLPKRLAHYNIETRVTKTSASTDRAKFSVSAKGKDAPYRQGISVPDDKYRDGWRMDVEKIRAGGPGGVTASNGGGDHGTCTGPDQNTVTANGFVYVADLGHTNGGAFGSEKKDAWVACNVTFPIVKQVAVEEAGPSSEGDISWTDDKKIDLPAMLKSFVLTLKVFNGRSYIVTDTRTPTPFVSIKNGGDYLLVQPNPPADF